MKKSVFTLLPLLLIASCSKTETTFDKKYYKEVYEKDFLVFHKDYVQVGHTGRYAAIYEEHPLEFEVRINEYHPVDVEVDEKKSYRNVYLCYWSSNSFYLYGFFFDDKTFIEISEVKGTKEGGYYVYLDYLYKTK